MPQVILTPQESEEYFLNALCDGLSYISGYNLSLEYDKRDYREAKEKLENPCYEDILMQILKDGKKLTLVDDEGCEEPASITLTDVHDRVQKTHYDYLKDMIAKEYDASTADAILQTVFLGEIVYG